MQVATQSTRFLWALPDSGLQAPLLETGNIRAGGTWHCLTMPGFILGEQTHHM